MFSYTVCVWKSQGVRGDSKLTPDCNWLSEIDLENTEKRSAVRYHAPTHKDGPPGVCIYFATKAHWDISDGEYLPGFIWNVAASINTVIVVALLVVPTVVLAQLLARVQIQVAHWRWRRKWRTLKICGIAIVSGDWHKEVSLLLRNQKSEIRNEEETRRWTRTIV